MHGLDQYLIMSAASPTTPPLLHGRYRILTRLGEGRLATVYRAEDQRLKRTVLVHLLRAELVQQPNLRRRFEEEAQRGAQRSHPGLLEVYDSGEVGGRPYMVTEDIAGRPLAEAGPLSPSEALSALRTIVSAVAMAQTQGVPHPPVSSRNVWLLTGGRVVLLENWDITPAEITRDLAPYRAPERARGAPPSPATSVYALGVLAWEAFVGRRPFTGATAEAIAQQQAQGELPPVSQERPALFSPELDRIVAQAVAADPSMRYTAPTDFGRALDHYNDAVSAQTGRLAARPYSGISAAVPAQPEPSTVRQRRSSRLSRASQPSQTQPAPAIAPPPPPPVIQSAPPPQTRTVAPKAVYDQRGMQQQIRREVKREVRRQGCQRALIKRSIQLLVVFALLYGSWLGIQFAVDYASGQVQQLNPSEWISSRLPDIDDFIPDWLRDPGSLVATYRVAQPVNLRSQPNATDDTLVAVLEEGTLLQQIGPAQSDATGQPYNWIQVIVIPDGQRGWVADLPGRIERQ
jgi:serine/threonine protein kinase